MAAPSVAVSAVDAFVTYISAALISLFGLNYYAMVWAFIGALVALTKSAKMTRLRAVFYVIFSTFIGALLGTAAGEYFTLSSRTSIAFLSLLGGMGWQGMIAVLLQVAEGRIRAYVPPILPPPTPPPTPAPAPAPGVTQ